MFGWNDDRPKRRKIDKNTRDAVWLKYMGNRAEGKCYCCQIRPIHITDFQVGHDKAVAKGGKDNISNLRPICGPCNRGMGTMSIEAYRKKYFGEQVKSDLKTGSLKKDVATDKPQTKKELLKTLSKPQLKKVIRECDLNYASFFDGDDKEDLIGFIMKAKSVTAKKIQKIINDG